MPNPTPTIFLPYHALDNVILRGTRAAQPAASAVTPGAVYFVTDQGVTERSNGTVWESWSDPAGLAARVTALEAAVAALQVVKGEEP